MSQIVTPEIVSGPDPEAEWDNPCPVCGRRHDQGPEGAAWGRQHCWSCGYTPGGATPAVPGAPVQPDWAKLIQDAVDRALSSPAQRQAIENTRTLGPEGMAGLAATEQARIENLGG